VTGTRLPHHSDRRFLTDGGIETDLIHRRGVDLPDFAAFPLLDTESGRAVLRSYYDDYLAIARASGSPLLLESPTWRANPDWGTRLGYSAAELARLNRAGIALMRELQAQYANQVLTLVSGSVGPRYDGYSADARLAPDEAADYHRPQLDAFAAAGADLATAYTITHVGEAVGIVRAARRAGLPVAVSFTVEPSGRLPSGAPLPDAIAETDAVAPADYYLLNCAYPTHIQAALSEPGPWTDRIAGIRANASKRSHAELDEAPELDDGDPLEFAADTYKLAARLPRLSILGGCCGTDARHIDALAHLGSPAAGSTTSRQEPQ